MSSESEDVPPFPLADKGKTRTQTGGRIQKKGLEFLPQVLEFVVAGGPGFEPRFTESESVVLPLNDPPTKCH